MMDTPTGAPMPQPGIPKAQPTGGPPPPMGAPPPMAGAPAKRQLPPDMQRFVDPNNPTQAMLVDRIMSLSDQEAHTLADGTSPQAAMIWKKVFPEIGFMMDRIVSVKQQQASAPGMNPPGAAGGQPAPTTTGPEADAEMQGMERAAGRPQPSRFSQVT